MAGQRVYRFGSGQCQITPTRRLLPEEKHSFCRPLFGQEKLSRMKKIKDIAQFFALGGLAFLLFWYVVNPALEHFQASSSPEFLGRFIIKIILLGVAGILTYIVDDLLFPTVARWTRLHFKETWQQGILSPTDQFKLSQAIRCYLFTFLVLGLILVW